MKRIWLAAIGLVFCGIVSSQQVPQTPQTPPVPRVDSDTAKLKVQHIEIGPEGIVIRDRQGKILKIQHSADLDLREIDSILKSSGKSKIEIERLKADLEALHDSLAFEFQGWEWGPEHNEGGIVRFGSSIHVAPGEVVEGDVVCLGNTINVDGLVRGSAVAIGGRVIVSNTGSVEGDAVAVGGHVIKHPGGRIEGENVSVGFVPIPTFSFYRGAQLASVILLFLVFVFMGIIGYALAPKHVNKIKAKLEEKFLKTVFLGILWQILILPVFLLLIITVIGIPVALLLYPLFLFLAFVLGFVAIAMYLGEKIKYNTRVTASSPTATVVLGTMAIFSLVLFWAILDFGGDWVPFLGGFHMVLLLLLAFAMFYLFATAGFGAAIMTRLGTRPKDVVPNPAVPPQATTSAHATT
ncbi:MAG: hypothetical protein A2Z27_01445 [candidate division Zixibacteria bacterium RBG_16_50_21]|nr:MAG: hypothetical protein A2Z27_01445 [candidate division Zixibacteria bacterium RBG_16_50_21]